MFEKEAEEYAKRSCFTEYPNPSLSEDIDISDEIKEAVLYGYNKATEWHYPSKGEYPPKGRQILAYAWNVHNVLAKYDTFDGKDRFVTFDAYNGFIEIKKVIRWQYIVPPKEEA